MKMLERITILLEADGCTINRTDTGHHDWKHGNIEYKGVRVGQMKIFRNELSHIKWYMDNAEVNAYSRPQIIADAFTDYDFIMGDDMYKVVLETAERLRNADAVRRASIRNALPHKKRKALAKRTVMSFIPKAVFALKQAGASNGY